MSLTIKLTGAPRPAPPSAAPRKLVVVVRTAVVARAAEAMRAAVGLTLRGDEVAVVLPEALSRDPGLAKGVATLLLLRQRVWSEVKLAELVRGADAVEVWT